jgi:IS30 family transposase
MEAKLELRWSPQQIASWLVLQFPDDAEMRVSHETIYLSLFVQSRGALRKELTRYLRMKRSVRRHGRKAPPNGQSTSRRWSTSVSDLPRPPPGRWPRQALFAGTGSPSPAS